MSKSSDEHSWAGWNGSRALREVQANRQKTRKPRATRIDVGVEAIDDALRDLTDHAVMWSTT